MSKITDFLTKLRPNVGLQVHFVYIYRQLMVSRQGRNMVVFFQSAQAELSVPALQFLVPGSFLTAFRGD
jgi:hypothetical protein